MRLSVAIVAQDEAANLPATLACVRWADEIVVVDSGSVDQTVAIAESYGARVVSQPWLGFAAQKNLAIAHCTGDWILSLDADEVVTLELRERIRAALADPGERVAFTIRRRNLFLGRWIRHGGFYPDSKLRLFRAGAARYRERTVHEVMHADGPLGELAADLIHNAYPSLESYIRHMDHYSSLGAEDLLARGRRPHLIRDAILRPALTFLYNYGLRGGFLDGRKGLLQHLYHAVYVSWKYAKHWEAARSAQGA